MKQHNRAVVVRALLQRGAVPRHKLAQLTNLRPSTITNVVEQLIQIGLLEELAPDTSISNPIGGRYPIPISVRSDGALALAIQFEPTAVAVALVNLKGQLVQRERAAITRGRDPAEVAQLLTTLGRRLLQTVAPSRVLGAGIAAHGLVNPETGINEYAAYHGWRHVPFATWLADALHLPVAIENSARAMALAEHWYGAGREVNDLILLTVGESVGAGILIEGHLYRGQAGLAGEIGHTTVVDNGLQCDCGKYGCLETVASTQAIARLAQAHGQAFLTAGTASAADVPDRLALARRTLTAATLGDPQAVEIVREVVRPLAVAVANLADVLDPQLVIIAGEVLLAEELVLAEVRARVTSQSLVPTEWQVPVVRAALGAEVSLIGAATLAFEQFLSSDALSAAVGDSPNHGGR
jgi:glucokinase-like ROK family protein